MKSYAQFLEENEQVYPEAQMFIDAWKQVMPNSSVIVKKGILNSQTLSFKFLIAKDKSETINGILDNDPLSYAGIFENGIFEETKNSMLVKPTNSNMAYSSVKFRKKTIKDVTPEKLVKRFQEVRKFIMDNAENLKNPPFNINEK